MKYYIDFYSNWTTAEVAPYDEVIWVSGDGFHCVEMKDQMQVSCVRHQDCGWSVALQRPNIFAKNQWCREERSRGAANSLIAPQVISSQAYIPLMDDEGLGILCPWDELWLGAYWFSTASGDNYARPWFEVLFRPREISRQDLMMAMIKTRCARNCYKENVDKFPTCESDCFYTGLTDDYPDDSTFQIPDPKDPNNLITITKKDFMEKQYPAMLNKKDLRDKFMKDLKVIDITNICDETNLITCKKSLQDLHIEFDKLLVQSKKETELIIELKKDKKEKLATIEALNKQIFALNKVASENEKLKQLNKVLDDRNKILERDANTCKRQITDLKNYDFRVIDSYTKFKRLLTHMGSQLKMYFDKFLPEFSNDSIVIIKDIFEKLDAEYSKLDIDYTTFAPIICEEMSKMLYNRAHDMQNQDIVAAERVFGFMYFTSIYMWLMFPTFHLQNNFQTNDYYEQFMRDFGVKDWQKLYLTSFKNMFVYHNFLQTHGKPMEEPNIPSSQLPPEPEGPTGTCPASPPDAEMQEEDELHSVSGSPTSDAK